MRQVGKHNEYTLKQAIEELLKTYRLDTKMNEVTIINSWEKVMGPVIMRYTKRIYIQNKVLYVELDSPALREELTFGKTRIMQLLNEAAGGIFIEEVILR